MDKAAFEAEAKSVIEAKLDELRQLSFSDASCLPGALAEDIVVAQKEVQLTIFRQQGIPEDPEAVLVTVQLARAGVGGLVSFHEEGALVFHEDGALRDATQDELLATGG